MGSISAQVNTRLSALRKKFRPSATKYHSERGSERRATYLIGSLTNASMLLPLPKLRRIE